MNYLIWSMPSLADRNIQTNLWLKHHQEDDFYSIRAAYSDSTHGFRRLHLSAVFEKRGSTGMHRGSLKDSNKDVKTLRHVRKIKISPNNNKKKDRNKHWSQSVYTIIWNNICYLAHAVTLSTVHFSDLSEHYWFLFHTLPTALPRQDAINRC